LTEGLELWRDAGGFALLTTADVALLSGFSTKTVRRAIADGELVASLVRGEYRVWPEDYRRWIEGGQVAREGPRNRARPATDRGSGSADRLRAMEADA
jgi:hypothetical protein